MEQMKLPGTYINVSKGKSYFPAILWYVLAATGATLKILLGKSHYNNFIIFRQVFWHTIHRANLYNEYQASGRHANWKCAAGRAR